MTQRIVFLGVCLGVWISSNRASFAQAPTPPNPPPAGTPASPAAPTAPATPAAPQASPEAQKQAIEEFKKGQELQKASDLDGALKQYEAAFALYPDPELQYLIAEVYRLLGDRDANYERYQLAIDHFEKYLQMSPNGKAAEAAKQRITVLKEGIANEQKRKDQEAADAKRVQEAEAETQKKIAQEKADKLHDKEGFNIVWDGQASLGGDKDFSGILKAFAGTIFTFGQLGLDTRLAFTGYLPLAGDKGVSGSTVGLDIGARFAFSANQFKGPFVGVGASYAFFASKPRERRLENDSKTCAGFEGEDCTFLVDKEIALRAGFGYGFSSSDKTTVAFRIDLNYWLYSVDADQDRGSPRAVQVEKPQSSLGVLVGLEFLRWM